MHTKLQEVLNSLEDVRAQATRLPVLLEELAATIKGAAEYARDVEHVEELAQQVRANTLRERELLANRAAELERLELNAEQREAAVVKSELAIDGKRAELASMLAEVAKAEGDLAVFGVAYLEVSKDGVKHAPLSTVQRELVRK